MQIASLPIADIQTDVLRRDRSLDDPDALNDLIRSIRDIGLRQPIEVFGIVPDDTFPLPYGLISGHRRLQACRALGMTEIPALLCNPADMPEAMVAMVAENEVRAQISPWEKGRLIVTLVETGTYATEDQAIAALYRSATRQQRARIRNFALVVDAFDPLIKTPERLSVARMDRLAAAVRCGWLPLLTAALTELETTGMQAPGLESQWAALQPVLTEITTAPTPTATGRPRRLLHLRQGLTIRRELTRTGYILRFSGPEARKGGLIDDVLDQVERWFQRE